MRTIDPTPLLGSSFECPKPDLAAEVDKRLGDLLADLRQKIDAADWTDLPYDVTLEVVQDGTAFERNEVRMVAVARLRRDAL